MKNLNHIRSQIQALHELDLLTQWGSACPEVDIFSQDIANLAAYVAFRRQDLRKLQGQLKELCLSSHRPVRRGGHGAHRQDREPTGRGPSAGNIVHGSATAPFGLMIARGDLAVELGLARLAEVQ